MQHGESVYCTCLYGFKSIIAHEVLTNLLYSNDIILFVCFVGEEWVIFNPFDVQIVDKKLV